MTFRKKLIEVALPLEAINKASAREKSIRHGHPSTLHLWWARRPLAACRAVIFSSLVDDPDDPGAHPEFVEACKKLPKGKNAAANDTPRQRLFDFIERLVTWEATNDAVIIKQARKLIHIATDGNPPPLLDPFAGGGSIPLEAQRLGLEAHASDLNPVAVMINKALIEIPPRFANKPPVNPRDRIGIGAKSNWQEATGLARDVLYYGEWLRSLAWEQIGDLYPEVEISNELLEVSSDLLNQGYKVGDKLTVIAWLWARTVKCENPACRIDTPLLTTFFLTSKKGRERYLVPNIQNDVVSFSIRENPPSQFKTRPQKGLKRGTSGVFECVRCGVITTRDYVAEQGRENQIGSTLTAIVVKGKSGRIYIPSQYGSIPKNMPKPDVADLELELSPNPRDVWCRNFGLNTPVDLFTKRQLTSLTTFVGLIGRVQNKILMDAIESGLSSQGLSLEDGGDQALAYSEAVSVYLMFAIDKGANYWSNLSSWHSGRDTITSTFSRQTLPMVWYYAEANPFSSSSGNFLSGINQAQKVLEKLVTSSNLNTAIQADAANNNGFLGLISTDPPYYDNISYADLSDFFYVWMRRGLRKIYPEIFSTLLVPKESEIVAIPYKFSGDRNQANKYFENGLFDSFSNMREMVLTDYPLTIYYAFKQSELTVGEGSASTGWETMLSGLIESGFSILGTWPVRTELTTNLKKNINVLASSIILVCRPRSDDTLITSRRDLVNILHRELPIALSEMQTGNIAPVDLAQASIGPGMAVFSRYTEVLEPNGAPMTVRSALQLINHELDSFLAEQEGYIDEDSRFAVAWFEQFGFNEGPFGHADVLARAKNTSVEGLSAAGVLESGAGKVRLLHWSELDPGWDPQTDKRLTTWETTHHLIEHLNAHGEEGAAQLLAKMPQDLATEARQLAYRLYNICDRKGWAEHARDYNALVVSWGASQEQAREFRDQLQQGKLFE